MSHNFKNGLDFPNEGFIQIAIEKHFMNLGFERQFLSKADLDVFHPLSGERWVVEAKGDTKGNSGLDFKTGLGQLLTRMDGENVIYAIALPNTERFIKLCKLIPGQARKALNLHFLLVDERGFVRQCEPKQDVDDLH